MTTLSVDQALIKAKSYIKKNEIVEAKKLYQAVLLAFPKNVRIQKELASLNNHTKDNVMKNPPSETIDQLVNLYNQGQYENVVIKAHSLTKEFPQAFVVWNILGAGKKALGQIEAASKAFKKVTELNPNYADGYNNLGAALNDQGKYEEAIEAYEKSILIRSDNPEAFYNIGNTLMDQNKLDKAIKAYKKSILLRPDYAKAYNNMGNALKCLGKLNEALTSYEMSITIDNDYADAYNNMGLTLKEQGKLDKS